MALGQPCRILDEEMPFEHWPIHDAKAYEQFKLEIEELKSVNEKDRLDVWLIGSDISLNAIETAEKNINHANLDYLFNQNQIKRTEHQRLNNPVVY